MRSPFVGLLLQQGHVHSLELVRQLDRADQRPLSLRGAFRQLTATEVERRNSWRATAGGARRLFPINSP
ncbi:hypothetical protein [Rhodanobacter geophilus]|uniref:Uncharacterized protein n=1 Tax=Rhodanobacter geophilus TaxID=3162488 RepID=A0ABV3QPZ3_9GAMM